MFPFAIWFLVFTAVLVHRTWIFSITDDALIQNMCKHNFEMPANVLNEKKNRKQVDKLTFARANTNLVKHANMKFVKKIYTTGFLGKNFYTLKVRTLRRFLLKRDSVNALILVILVNFMLEFN